MLDTALSAVLGLERPADLALREVFRRNPALGRRDRGVIAETAFDVLRNRRLYGHLAQGMVGPMSRRLMALSLQARFGPQVLAHLGVSAGDELSLQHASSIDPASLPQSVRLSLPDWLHTELLAQSGGAVADVERLGQALLKPAPLDLRVNLLKSDRQAVLAALSQAGIEADALDEPATAIRVHGKPAIERMAAFEQGWFEVQDAGSQQLVAFAAPRRGQTVVDFPETRTNIAGCAGR
jgi:16S rRNA (cytosine967-C5)-methyltransferase